MIPHPDHALVYYALDATRTQQRVKIGTTMNLSERMRVITSQCASRQQPVVLAVEFGGIRRESQLHARFAEFRLSGEWFRYCGDLQTYIARLPNPHGWLADNEDLWHLANGWAGTPFTTKTGSPDYEPPHPREIGGYLDGPMASIDPPGQDGDSLDDFCPDRTDGVYPVRVEGEAGWVR